MELVSIRSGLAVVAMLVAVGCSGVAAEDVADSTTTTAPETAPTTTTGPTTTSTTETVPATALPDPASFVPDLSRPLGRVFTATAYQPFATVGGFDIHYPSARIETIGFHESGHDGAQQMDPLDGLTVEILTMPSRDRGTGSRTAADIAVDPALDVLAPVTGTVIRSGTYTLYCEHRDDFVVIAPDEQPTWEVKMFHIDGVQVVAGERVEAGRTVIAPGPTPLPFRSQLDEFTAEPSWAHVHVEIVDPAIPDRPSGGGC